MEKKRTDAMEMAKKNYEIAKEKAKTKCLNSDAFYESSYKFCY